MEIKKKQRLIGALVLLAVVAVLLPFLFQNPHPTADLSLLETMPTAPPESSLRLDLPMELDSTIEYKPPSPMPTEPKPESLAVKVEPKAVLPTAAPIAPQKSVPEKKSITGTVMSHLSDSLPQAWTLQVATFIQPANAEKLVQQLRAKGWDVYSRPMRADRKSVTRVFIGPEINYDKIKRAQQQVEKQFHFSGIVLRYHP